jgi:ketosteroid isomerase-like protein
MTERGGAGGLDLEAVRRAQEEHDLDLLVDLYAEDAVLRRIDRKSPPSSPMELRGKEQIAEYWRDIFSRNMTHRVEDVAAGEDHVAFNVACEYADGTKVLAAENLEVRDGKIVREVSVQAWDE